MAGTPVVRRGFRILITLRAITWSMPGSAAADRPNDCASPSAQPRAKLIPLKHRNANEMAGMLMLLRISWNSLPRRWSRQTT